MEMVRSSRSRHVFRLIQHRIWLRMEARARLVAVKIWLIHP